MARKIIVGDRIDILKGRLVTGHGVVVELRGRHHAVLHEKHLSAPESFHVVVARQHVWESVAMFGASAGGVESARALAKSRAATHRKIHRTVLGIDVPGRENTSFFASIEGTYQDAIDDLGLKGFWLLCDLDDGYVCGWAIGCPDGARIEIPSPETRHTDGTGPAYVDRIVDAFFEAEAHRVVPGSTAVRAA